MFCVAEFRQTKAIKEFRCKSLWSVLEEHNIVKVFTKGYMYVCVSGTKAK